MCGIVGYVNSKKGRDRVLIKKMANLIHHRGPDADGYFVGDGVALGHKRLSIIDLSGGNQPVEENDYVLVFNGEIYNFRELRRDLKKKGCIFRTSSDTEVLMKMYVKYGEKCLKYLNGMFVFAVWNRKRGELFLARDRLGVKPLFYSVIGSELVFSSEIKSILCYPGMKKSLNRKVVNSYFQYRYVVGDETLFEGVNSLLPGNFMKFKLGEEPKIQSYWSLPIISEKEDLGEKFYIQRVRDLVNNSVKQRMVADVKVGSYLSGGLDSSILTAVMSKLRPNNPVDTFSIGFKDEKFNEFKYARMVAKMWKTNHHEILLTADEYLKTMKDLISFKDAPLAVPNEVPLYLMSKKLRKYITVVLSGEGADELFGGYGRIFISYLNYDSKVHGSYLDLFLSMYNYVSDDDLSKFLSIDILAEVNEKKYTYSIFSDIFRKISKLPIEDQIPYVFQNIHIQGLLQRVDMTTMATSVEGRVPFVDDYELVEFVNAIPFKYKIKWISEKLKNKAIRGQLTANEISEKYDTTKYLLRKSFRNMLPEGIVERKKVGFPVPLDNWFKGDFKTYAIDLLTEKKTLNRGIFDVNYLKSKLFIEDLSGINIWMMVNFELFMREYFD